MARQGTRRLCDRHNLGCCCRCSNLNKFLPSAHGAIAAFIVINREHQQQQHRTYRNPLIGSRHHQRFALSLLLLSLFFCYRLNRHATRTIGRDDARPAADSLLMLHPRHHFLSSSSSWSSSQSPPPGGRGLCAAQPPHSNGGSPMTAPWILIRYVCD